MQTRILGGEGGRRSFFGGSHGKTRTIGLVIVAIAGSFLTILFSAVGLALTIAAFAVVFAATIRTHRGSPMARWQAKRRWKERLRTGTIAFAPVGTRPAALDNIEGTRSQRKAGVKAWNCYRDWPDGAEGMHWLQRGIGEPGIAWHTPTGEDPYLSVAFAVEGQVRGIESDQFLESAMTAFGVLLARYGSPAALPNRVQSVTRVVPIDSAFHEAWVWGQIDDELAVQSLITSYDEVVRKVARSGLMQRHYFVIRWPLTAEFMAAAARRGPAQAGWRALMSSEIASVRSHLRAAKFGNVAAVTAAQLAAVLRHMQHPSWPIDQAADVDVDAPWLPSRDQWSATMTQGPGPDGNIEQWWHRTAVLPIQAVETGPRNSMWLAPLLSQMPHPIVRTLSLQIEVVPATDARHAARTDVTTDLADLEGQKEKGVLTGEELAAGLVAARGRLADLRPGSGHHGAGWVGHLTISAPTRGDLLDATTKITEAAGNAGISSLEWLDTQQSAAMACTWPLARGMAPVAQTTASSVRRVLAGSGNKEAF
ncbi:MAG: hypothetical protein ABI661_04625 [Gammaproteobacteria bacterium]